MTESFDNYLTLLLKSELPFEATALLWIWVALFLANFWAARAARAANEAQSVFTVQDWNALRRVEPKYTVVRFIFFLLAFTVAFLLGGPAFVFLGGGLSIAIAFVLAMNLQGVMSARALRDPNSATGTLTFSTPFAFRHLAHRLSGGAIACVLMGLAIAHLALLGGAFFLASMAGGCLLRARKSEHAAAT